MKLKFFFVILIFYLHETCSESFRSMAYDNVNSSVIYTCFRFSNVTHKLGCATSSFGNYGYLVPVYTKEHLNRLKLFKYSDFNIMVLLDVLLYVDELILNSLLRNKKIKGIIIDVSEESKFKKIAPYSSDLTYPNKRTSIYNKKAKPHPFVSRGSGTKFLDLPFPLVLTHDMEEIFRLVECYKTFNTLSTNFSAIYTNETLYNLPDPSLNCPYCAVSIRAEMECGADSNICHRRSYMFFNLNSAEAKLFSIPINGFNVFSTFTGWPSKNNTKNYILFTTKMDAITPFAEMTPGINSPVSNLITFFSVVNSMNLNKKAYVNSTFIPIFAIFNGESLDYIGSNSFLHSMEGTSFDIKKVNTIIDIGPMLYPNSNDVFFHSDTNFISSLQLENLANILTTTGIKNSSINSFPPSSIHSFLRRNNKINAFHISNYDFQMNHHYNTFLDNLDSYFDVYPTYNESTHHTRYMKEVAGKIFCFLHKILSNSTNCNGLPPISESLISELFYCMTINSNCELYNSSVEPGYEKYLPNRELQEFYVSSRDLERKSEGFLVYMMRMLMIRFTGNKVKNLNCWDKEKKKRSLYVKPLESPAFLLQNGVQTTNRYLLEEMEPEKEKLKKIGKDEGLTDFKDDRVFQCFQHFTFDNGKTHSNFLYDGSDVLVDEKNGFMGWSESIWIEEYKGVSMFLVPCQSHELLQLLSGIIVTLISILLALLLKKFLFSSLPPLGLDLEEKTPNIKRNILFKMFDIWPGVPSAPTT